MRRERDVDATEVAIAADAELAYDSMSDLLRPADASRLIGELM